MYSFLSNSTGACHCAFSRLFLFVINTILYWKSLLLDLVLTNQTEWSTVSAYLWLICCFFFFFKHGQYWRISEHFEKVSLLCRPMHVVFYTCVGIDYVDMNVKQIGFTDFWNKYACVYDKVWSSWSEPVRLTGRQNPITDFFLPWTDVPLCRKSYLRLLEDTFIVLWVCVCVCMFFFFLGGEGVSFQILHINRLYGSSLYSIYQI